MSFTGVEGETYLLRVGGFDGERGTGTISVEYGDGPPDAPNIDFQHDGLTRQYRIYMYRRICRSPLRWCSCCTVTAAATTTC